MKSDRGVDILGEIVTKPELRSWEVHDAHKRLDFDLDVYDESPQLSKQIFKNEKKQKHFLIKINFI